MELLTEELRAQLPPLYAQERVKEEDKIVYAKFFTPSSCWTWFVTEGAQQEDDFLFFGYVIGFAREWGYFSLSELQDSCGPCGPTVDRDLNFEPKPFTEAEREYNAVHGAL
jgi:hypothetical protein